MSSLSILDQQLEPNRVPVSFIRLHIGFKSTCHNPACLLRVHSREPEGDSSHAWNDVTSLEELLPRPASFVSDLGYSPSVKFRPRRRSRASLYQFAGWRTKRTVSSNRSS